MMNMSRFLCVGVSAAALLYCSDVWASEIYGTSVPEGYQAYNLNESGLNAGMMLSLPPKGAKQVASVVVPVVGRIAVLPVVQGRLTLMVLICANWKVM